LGGGGWALGQSPPPSPRTLAPQAPRVIDRVKSEYNDIEVMQTGTRVSLLFRVGRCLFTESEFDTAQSDFLPVEYTRFATTALIYPPRLSRFLEIGLGGGRTVSYLHRFVPNMAITTVEIDPAVVAMAKKHFGVREDERLKIIVDDGRRYAMQTSATYDVIFVDAFRGTWVPETLTTVEFFQLLKSRLNRGGVVAQNVEPTTLFYDRMVATLRTVFANVDAYATDADTEFQNTVLVAYDGPRLTAAQVAARARALQRRHRFRHDLTLLAAGRRPLTAPPTAQPLRDGFDGANTALMIDRANDRNTPRQRRAACE
jgi:spermidine synthase